MKLFLHKNNATLATPMKIGEEKKFCTFRNTLAGKRRLNDLQFVLVVQVVPVVQALLRFPKLFVAENANEST